MKEESTGYSQLKFRSTFFRSDGDENRCKDRDVRKQMCPHGRSQLLCSPSERKELLLFFQQLGAREVWSVPNITRKVKINRDAES